MNQRAQLGGIVTDLRIGLPTILPLGPSTPVGDGEIARASWTLAVAGLLVGLVGAALCALAYALGLREREKGAPRKHAVTSSRPAPGQWDVMARAKRFDSRLMFEFLHLISRKRDCAESFL
jgi:hypothetical protein